MAGQPMDARVDPVLPPAARTVLKTFTTLLAQQRTKADLKEFERVLVAADASDALALASSGFVWRLLQSCLEQADTQWELFGLLLNRFSLEPECRAEALNTGYIAQLAEQIETKGKAARGDKVVERIGDMACILALLSVDAPEAQISHWCKSLCMSVKDSLERSQGSKGSALEAYAVLSIFIKLIYTATGSNLAVFLATTFANETAGGVQLLFRVAKRGLLEEELSGVPKIVAEKSLVILSKLNADAPDAQLVPNQLDPLTLGIFLVRIGRDCSWVQSQDIAINFLARLVFDQDQIGHDFLHRPEVLDMLRHVLVGCKSTALKMTGIAFISCCHAELYHQLASEFDATLNLLAACPARTLKHVVWEAGRGIWGIPCPLCPEACLAMRESEFLRSAAEKVPAFLPRCLWQLLPPDLQRQVASSQGILVPVDGEDDDGGEDEPEDNAAGQWPDHRYDGRVGGGAETADAGGSSVSPQEDGAAGGQREGSAGGWQGASGGRPHRRATTALGGGAGTAEPSREPTPQPPQTLPLPAAAAQLPRPPSQLALNGRAPQESVYGASPSAGETGRLVDGRHVVDVSRLDPEVQRLLANEGLLGLEDNGPQAAAAAAERPEKPTIRIKKSVVETVEAVLALQQLHEGASGKGDNPVNAAAGPSGEHAERQQQQPQTGEAGAAAKRPRNPPARFGPAAGQQSPEADTEEGGAQAAKRPRMKRTPPQAQGAAGSNLLSGYAGMGNAFGTEDIRELNTLLDTLYAERSALGPRGHTLIKNMAEGAANISMVVYLRTYRLPPQATAGLDERLATLKSRAQLVYNGVMSDEGLELLLPFSELLSAESGVIRRDLEAYAKAANVPATSTEGAANYYTGGDAIRYSMY